MSSNFSQLAFAGDSLESLECSLESSDELDSRRAVQKIGKFTASVDLQLSEFRPAGEDFTAMQSLPLQELVLLHCQNLEIHLLVPGALLSLRRIHIEDTDRRKQKIRN